MQVGGISFKTGKTESLDIIGASLLWEFLKLRYDNIELTQHFLNFIHDAEFKILVRKGLSVTLERQVNLLEKELNELKIQLPVRPPKSINTDIGSELFEDRFIYRQIYTNVQAAFYLHARGIFAMTFNDKLRTLFIGFLKEEADIYDDMVKYGKLKGWIQPSPIHKPI